ncbi:hypothetical protein IAU60_004856 [Kwoniella sp. DSM 27419]
MHFTTATLVSLAAATLVAATPVSRDEEITFINAWPETLVGGQPIELSWTGGSQSYDVLWIEESNNGDNMLIHTVLQDSTDTATSLWFTPAKCYAPDATHRFVVYDSKGVAGPFDRGYSPKLSIVAGNNEGGNC